MQDGGEETDRGVMGLRSFSLVRKKEKEFLWLIQIKTAPKAIGAENNLDYPNYNNRSVDRLLCNPN